MQKTTRPFPLCKQVIRVQRKSGNISLHLLTNLHKTQTKQMHPVPSLSVQLPPSPQSTTTTYLLSPLSSPPSPTLRPLSYINPFPRFSFLSLYLPNASLHLSSTPFLPFIRLIFPPNVSFLSSILPSLRASPSSSKGSYTIYAIPTTLLSLSMKESDQFKSFNPPIKCST